MAQIIIHRGTQTIGGSCVEIRHKNDRILLDLGLPLMADGGCELNVNDLARPSIDNGILPDIKGLYKTDQPSVSAVFISHAHFDHCGLLDHVHPDIPVYCSAGTHTLITIGRVFYPDSHKISFDNYKIFKHWESIGIGTIKITSFLMDHSSYDASAFLVEVDNKRIFYTGDFRGHGRKSILFDNLVKKPVPDIDCLLMEGTTLGGKHQIGFNNENEVENEFYNLFYNQKDVSFIASSGSNIDRLVSLYKASLRCRKTLVLDLYTYYLLEQLKQLTPGLPPFKGDNLRIYYLYGHSKLMNEHLGKIILYKLKYRKIELDEIIDNRKNMIIKLPLSGLRAVAKKMLSRKPLDNAKFIYSMWQGYLEKDGMYEKFCNEFNVELIQVHVSGHAYLSDLKKLASALSPRKIIPIHTLSGQDYQTHFDNVYPAIDRVPIDI